MLIKQQSLKQFSWKTSKLWFTVKRLEELNWCLLNDSSASVKLYMSVEIRYKAFKNYHGIMGKAEPASGRTSDHLC